MTRPDLYACPSCLTPLDGLAFVRLPPGEEGSRRGCFYTCTCRALTKSIDQTVNLRDDVAQAYGITKRPDLKPVGPTLRRKK